jgi:uncharacterized protein (TIGR02147 family)
MADLFEFRDYKGFLNVQLDEMDAGGRGTRARMSRAIGCQTAYTAQVLRGPAHFSLEQAEAINDFLGHSYEQGHYFLLLLQLAKAGSPKLRVRFERQLDEMAAKRSLLKNRLGIETHLAEREQLIYYSSWVYGAIHALVSIPGFQTPERISRRLGIGVGQAGEALEFLVQAGLLERDPRGNLRIGKQQVHLGADSPLIAKHHINWRFQAVRAIEQNPRADLHYSSVISISKEDQKRIQHKLEEMIKSLKTVIRESHEEEVCSLSIDFFRL